MGSPRLALLSNFGGRDCLTHPGTEGRADGYEISRVTEFLPPTATDFELLDLARREGAVLITADLDFSALIATSGGMSPSLVSLRLAFPTPERVTAVLEQALPGIQADLERGAIASIDEASIRVRRLPIT